MKTTADAIAIATQYIHDHQLSVIAEPVAVRRIPALFRPTPGETSDAWCVVFAYPDAECTNLIATSEGNEVLILIDCETGVASSPKLA